MPTYVWQGRSRQGERKVGEIEAADEDLAKEKLRQQGLVITSFGEQAPKAPSSLEAAKAALRQLLAPSVSTKDLVVFTRPFATMIDAGLPMVQSLELLGGQEANVTLRNTIFAVKQRVETGKTLSESLGQHPKVFNRLYVNLVAAGESAGVLDTILGRLGNYIEKNMKLVKQIKSAMVYPTLVVGVAFAVTIVLLVFVIPVFEKMFREMNATLPAPTQAVIDMSNWVQANIVYLIAAGVGLAWGARRLLATKRGRWAFDSGLLRMPIIGPLSRKVAVANFTRTLGTMLSSGVNILEALDIVAGTAGNVVVEAGLVQVRGKIAEGKAMAGLLAELPIFPSMVVQMIAVGESTGALDNMLNKIADFYDDEVDAAVTTMMAALEPIIMAFLAVILGGLVISMYLPVFTMAGSMSGG